MDENKIVAEETVSSEEALAAEQVAIEEVAESESETNRKKKRKKEKKVNKHPYRWIIKLGKLIVKIAILMIIFCSLWIWVGNVYITHDNNMYPHIKDGDLIVTYKLQGYIIDDIVLYQTSRGNKVGRIVAKPGDIVEITEDGYYAINGILPYENVFYDTLPSDSSEIEYPYTVPEGEYFILNDMREIQTDSRKYGSVSEDAFLGKVVMIARHRGM